MRDGDGRMRPPGALTAGVRGTGRPWAARLKGGAGAAGLAGLLLLAAACGGGDAGAGEAAHASADSGSQSAAVRQEADTAGGPAAPADGELPLTTLDVAGHEVRVEVADDDEERRQGLMHRDSLPRDRGMLFVYSEEQTLSFYMRNTQIPLDIAFLDRRGYIVDIQQMEPHSEELHRSSHPAMYALEMNRGWFEAHGVGEGDRVRF